MPRYLLDTNILSDLIRYPAGVVAHRIARLSSQERQSLCTSIIVAAELRFGAEKKNSARLVQRVNEILSVVDVLSFGPDADRHYARLRAALERAGSLIGANDMLIASHAFAAGCTLITDNQAEFSRVSGLRTQNWLRSR
jgi:tRNA(fMet)-specific endonuclease VapC